MFFDYKDINKRDSLCDVVRCGAVKILFVVRCDNKLVIDLLQYSESKDFFEEINYENVDIDLIPSREGIAIFGHKGSSGVILITIKEKKCKWKINKILNKIERQYSSRCDLSNRNS